MSKTNFLTYKDLRKMVTKNDLQYLMLVGQRSNGKSYAAKEDGIRNYLENGLKFFVVRRYDEDVKPSLVEKYLADMTATRDQDTKKIIREPIKELTHGNYTTVSAYRGNIYFANIDESGKVKRGDHIGYYGSLNKAERLKSQNFDDADVFIFEEFITNKTYLLNEPTELQQLISTVCRLSTIRVYMVGNTLSRINPYYSAWGLQGTSKQKQGELGLYAFKGDDNTKTNVGVLLCEALNKRSRMTFGSAAKQIAQGYYHSDPQNKLTGDIEDYEVLHTIVFIYDNHGFLLQLLRHKYNRDHLTWYVQPKSTRPQSGTRIITDAYSEDPLVTHSFKMGLNEREIAALKMIPAGKIAYSDDLTGTEFRQCYKMLEMNKI